MALPENTARFLSGLDARFTPEIALVLEPPKAMGYSTRLPAGSQAHGTRVSADYAIGLLMRRESGDIARAASVMDAVLGLQDCDPTSATYGAWPWFFEEPLCDMDPPDLNWADFIGVRIAQILVAHRKDFDPALQERLEKGLEHATFSIFRRNVSLGYTNIAVMGGAACVLGGEILKCDPLLSYGRLKLQHLVERTREHGGFSEYNSPAYTMVVLEECERILQLAMDGEAREAAECLRTIAWRTIAEHFHPGTCQWAGPHSRSYSQWIDGRVADYLAKQTGAPIPLHPKAAAGSHFALVKPIPCPEELRGFFLKPRRAEFSARFLLRERVEDSVSGTTWMNEAACIGSVNRDTMRDQRRVLLAYWKTDDDPAVMLRLRFWKNGRDFASAFVRNAQRGPRVLTAVNMLTNQGDVYPFDRPADGLFAASDFRLVYELAGCGVIGQQTRSGQYELSAGGWKAVIHTLAGRFGDSEVVWNIHAEQDCVRLEGVCYAGEERKFDLASLGPVILAAGLELLPRDEAPSAESPGIHLTGQSLTLHWETPGPLDLTAPTTPEFYPYLLSPTKV